MIALAGALRLVRRLPSPMAVAPGVPVPAAAGPVAGADGAFTVRPRWPLADLAGTPR
jgi:hypothetical protein